jgi:hypothetical protein
MSPNLWTTVAVADVVIEKALPTPFAPDGSYRGAYLWVEYCLKQSRAVAICSGQHNQVDL